MYTKIFKIHEKLRSFRPSITRSSCFLYHYVNLTRKKRKSLLSRLYTILRGLQGYSTYLPANSWNVAGDERANSYMIVESKQKIFHTSRAIFSWLYLNPGASQEFQDIPPVSQLGTSGSCFHNYSWGVWLNWSKNSLVFINVRLWAKIRLSILYSHPIPKSIAFQRTHICYKWTTTLMLFKRLSRRSFTS